MINKTRRVFYTPNKETYDKNKFITQVKIEMMLPIGKLTTFDHNVKKKAPVNLPTITKLNSRSQAIQIANDLIQ